VDPGTWNGFSEAPHCDNLAAPGWYTSDHGLVTGNSHYVLDLDDQSTQIFTNCSDPESQADGDWVDLGVETAGYFNPPVGPSQPPCDAAHAPRNPDCDNIGAIYVSVDVPVLGPVAVGLTGDSDPSEDT
jgi:hypothetical protein